MKRLILIFLLFIAAVLLGVQLQHDPGYVLLAINHWTVETTVLVLCLVLIFSFLLLHYLLRILAYLSNIPTAVKNWLIRRRSQKAQARTQQGLIEFSEGYWAKAKNHLISALPDADLPLLNYLTAARAAQEMGDNQARDDYLRKAQQSMPDAQIAVELTQAQLQLAKQQWEQALATLKHLQDLVPTHPYVLKLLMYLYKEVQDWNQLIALLPTLKQQQIISDVELQQLKQEVYLAEMLVRAKIGDFKVIESFIENLPRSLRYEPELMQIYCRVLLDQHEETKAEAVLRRSLQQGVNDKLLNLYGQLRIGNKALRFAESLIKKYPNSAALYMCLGRLSLHEHLWGKARSYFAQSIHLMPTPEAYAAFGELLAQCGDQVGAYEAYKQGLFLCTRHS